MIAVWSVSETSLSCVRTDCDGDVLARFGTGISEFLTLLCIPVVALSYSCAAGFHMVELELLDCI